MSTKSKLQPSATRQVRSDRLPLPPAWFRPAVWWTVITALLGVTLLFLSSANDVYVLPKLVFVAFCALALLGFYGWSLAQSGTLRIARSPLVVVAVVLCGLMSLATIVNEGRMRSLFGEYGRGGGLLAYLAATVLLAGLTAEFDEDDVRRLVRCVCWAAAGVVVYGLLQKAGVESFGAPSQGLVMATLGQVNFVAGFSGVVLPLLLFIAASPGERTHWRLAALAAALGSVVIGLSTSSFQAFVSLGVGGCAFGLLYLKVRWGNRALIVAAGALVVVLAVTGLVANQRIDREIRSSMNERVLMWEAARGMVADHPFLGTGPQGYAANFTTYRPREHTLKFGVFQIADAPHSVPLGMFVAGGVPLGVAYVTFVGIVGWMLVRGLRRTTGKKKMLLGSLGAAWLAYQAQSLVSIDMPTFIVWHLLLAGAIGVLVSSPEPKTIVVRSMVGRSRRGPVITSAGRGVQASVLVVAMLGVVFLARSLVADVQFAKGKQSAAANDLPAALSELHQATSVAPWYGTYWAAYASALAKSGDQDGALRAGTQSALQAPSSASWALSTAQLAQAMGKMDVADRWFRYAQDHSPGQPEVLNARGDYLLAVNRPREAIGLFRQAVAGRPAEPTFFLHLGQALELAGQKSEAKHYYQQALTIKADQPDALAGLQRLG